jgi:hypothetical protein
MSGCQLLTKDSPPLSYLRNITQGLELRRIFGTTSVFMNKVLRKICDPKKERKKGQAE